jgi:hypothetical protein
MFTWLDLVGPIFVGIMFLGAYFPNKKKTNPSDFGNKTIFYIGLVGSILFIVIYIAIGGGMYLPD